jgi:hypothetical protein
MGTRYECVVPSADGSRVLLVRDEGRWSLPHVLCWPDRLWDAAPDVQREFRARYGMEVAALRTLGKNGLSVICELEALPESSPPAGSAWQPIESLPPDHLATVKNRDAGDVAPWQRRGWLEEVRAWIAARVAVRAIAQVKAGWSQSCVLEVATDGEPLFFKASPRSGMGEPAFIRALSRSWGAHLPQIVDADEERCWMLMRRVEGHPIEQNDPAALADAARFMARMQLDQAPHAARWIAMGCADRGFEALRRQLPRLLTGIPEWFFESGALTAAERDEMAALVPRAEALCRALSDIAIPPVTIHHEDFRDAHVYRTPSGSLVIIDWSDAAIAHPLLTLQRFLRFMALVTTPENPLCHVLRDAYLDELAAFEPRHRLLEACRLSARLVPLYDLFRFTAGGAAEPPVRSELPPDMQKAARALMKRIREGCC